MSGTEAPPGAAGASRVRIRTRRRLPQPAAPASQPAASESAPLLSDSRFIAPPAGAVLAASTIAPDAALDQVASVDANRADASPDAQATPAPNDALEGWIATGRVMGTYGAAGELRVQPLGRFPERFRELRRVFVGERFEPANVVHRRAYRNGLILRLDRIRNRETARDLIGSYLYVPESEAVPLPAGEYFVHQIVGLTVRTSVDQELGSVVEVLQTGSNDVYVVKGPQGEVLLPAIKEVIRSIDLDAGTMLVTLLPGLVD